MALTKRQKQILDYVESFIENYGYSPSFEEIADFFGYSSLATVHEHLSNLERKGYLRKNYNKSRSLEVIPAEGDARRGPSPCSATVAAGLPIEADRGAGVARGAARHAARGQQLRAAGQGVTRWWTNRSGTGTTSS